MRELVVVAHDMRSTHNIGSLFRTCDAMGVKKLYLTGYTAYPKSNNDSRLPHIADKLNAQIKKTALGATETVCWEHIEDVESALMELKRQGFHIVALEQAPNSKKLPYLTVGKKQAILLGTEVTGVPAELLERVDTIVEIPMLGKKESLNVVQAAAMMLYHARFSPF